MKDMEAFLAQDKGSSLIGTAVSLLVLSWITVGLRIYTRAVLMKSIMADDWLMIIAQIIFTASCAMIIEGVRQGLGRHNDAIQDDDAKVAALMWQAIATITYIMDMMFVKLSIGVFLLRLSAQKVYTYIIWTSLAVVSLYTLGVFFWDVFQCNPVAKQWDYRITSGHCATPQDIINAAYAISVMTLVSDWLYALLPVPMLWNVKMTKQAKATVIVILGLGIFASIATLIRLAFLARLEDSEDLLYSGTEAMVWTLVEPGVAIIASSLATIRPLLRRMRVRGFESTGRTHPSSAFSSAHATKRQTSSMPGHGPLDVSLDDVVNDTSALPKKTTAMSAKQIGFDAYHHQALQMTAKCGNVATVSAGRTGGGGGGGAAGTNGDGTRHQPSPSMGRRPSEAPSETYVIEGTKHSPAWSAQEGDRSVDEMYDLEEQSQEYRHGISGMRR